MHALAQHQLAGLEREACQRLFGRNARLDLDGGDVAILRIFAVAGSPGLGRLAVLLLAPAHAGARRRMPGGADRSRPRLCAVAGIVPIDVPLAPRPEPTGPLCAPTSSSHAFSL
ncbi:hypothetical protein G6F40_016977 [Rhizopus arrhizus]|nr:hypothetical protein G6F40_016977 [Rhizopus arrhizus]